MNIEGFQYDVEGYRLRFRMTKKRLLILAGLAALSLILGATLAHADPTIWPTWASGGGGGRYWRV